MNNKTNQNKQKMTQLDVLFQQQSKSLGLQEDDRSLELANSVLNKLIKNQMYTSNVSGFAVRAAIRMSSQVKLDNAFWNKFQNFLFIEQKRILQHHVAAVQISYALCKVATFKKNGLKAERVQINPQLMRILIEQTFTNLKYMKIQDIQTIIRTLSMSQNSQFLQEMLSNDSEWDSFDVDKLWKLIEGEILRKHIKSLNMKNLAIIVKDVASLKQGSKNFWELMNHRVTSQLKQPDVTMRDYSYVVYSFLEVDKLEQEAFYRMTIDLLMNISSDQFNIKDMSMLFATAQKIDKQQTNQTLAGIQNTFWCHMADSLEEILQALGNPPESLNQKLNYETLMNLVFGLQTSTLQRDPDDDYYNLWLLLEDALIDESIKLEFLKEENFPALTKLISWYADKFTQDKSLINEKLVAYFAELMTQKMIKCHSQQSFLLADLQIVQKLIELLGQNISDHKELCMFLESQKTILVEGTNLHDDLRQSKIEIIEQLMIQQQQTS